MVTTGSSQLEVGVTRAPIEPSRLDRLRGRRRDREDEAVARAVARERRRIVADVHDLIMQDLALALANARALVDDADAAPLASTIVAAGERALAGARQIMDTLAAQDGRPVVETVEASVRAAARHVPVSFVANAVPADLRPDEPTLDALLHIGREAVTNAIKHADPTAVQVVLERTDEWRLQVRDNGCGFVATDAGGGFGLESMRQHAEALGGTLRLLAGTGMGTTVEAILP
jgi:signal transduction histidine kinase